MIHPCTELRYISDQIGYGLVATCHIPRGTLTWVRDELDQVFPPEYGSHLPPLLQERLDTYSFRDHQGNRILCWDHARYINHSCRPNCVSADFDFELAVRDILPGEELTDDYGTLNIDVPFACHCREAQCRLLIRPDDVLRQAVLLDRWVEQALPPVETVAQPLWPLLRDPEKLLRIVRGECSLPSLASHYFSAGTNGATQAGSGW
jgi:uncharacterized protein